MTRIVNRVPTLREPSRLHHDIRACGGLRPFLSAMVQKYGTLAPSVFEYGYGDRDRWQIPDDPFDVSVWLEPFYPPRAGTMQIGKRTLPYNAPASDIRAAIRELDEETQQ